MNKSFRKLYILHATGWGKEGEVIGQYKVHYEDETEETISIVYGKDVRNWWNIDHSKPVSRGKVVWEGSNLAATRDANATLRLYLTMWKNPQPEKEVVSIDYISTKKTYPAPFCVAMTVEEPAGAETDE